MSTPKRLGKYELQEQLGSGGIADVWKALDTRLQRYVAIKLLQPNLREDPDFIKRFEREAQLIAALHHPNIVQIHDFQVLNVKETDDAEAIPHAYMVMDYIEGETLAAYIKKMARQGQHPSPEELVNLFTSISLAVDFAHQQGMIHRDIKPANILLDSRNTSRNSMGEPILSDFGVAKLLSTSTSTLTGTQLGTPLYISPEQARGYPGNERSDLYSLGVILYELVTGFPPFRATTPMEVITQHIKEAIPDPTLFNPQIPPALSQVIQRGLAKEPQQRFSSAAMFTIAIAEALRLPPPNSLGVPGFPAGMQESPTHFSVSPSQTPRSATPFVRSPAASQPDPTSMATVMQAESRAPINGPGVQTAISPPLPTTIIPPQAAPGPKTRRSGLFVGLLIALIVLLLGSALATALLLLSHTNTATSPLVGQAFYISSGQNQANTAHGIADQLKVSLQNIAAPKSGNSYYLWLLGDRTPEKNPDDTGPRPFQPPLLLTNNLPVNNNSVDYFYQGDQNHDNLISVTSRLLITEQSAGQHPTTPSTNPKDWRYYAEIPQMQIPGAKASFSALTHIRHLFYNETNIEVLGLPGGLDFWMLNHSSKVLEWSISARDYWQGTETSDNNISLMKNQFIRILDYLDGSLHIQADLPADTPFVADRDASRVALLSIGGQLQATASTYKTDPPGYVDHVRLHVDQIAKAPGVSSELRKHASTILDAVSHANTWLMAVRQDAVQLFQMSNNPDQLRTDQAGSMLDDMETNAQYAYLGKLDPTTNTVVPGILQAHYEVQQLAVLPVTSKLPSSL